MKKDILNSIKFLNNNGFILVHDCLPSTLSSQAVPRYKMLWHGDVANLEKQDTQTKTIRDLNLKIKKDNRVKYSLLPLSDGLSFIQKK